MTLFGERNTTNSLSVPEIAKFTPPSDHPEPTGCTPDSTQMVIRCYVTYTGVYKFDGMLLSYDFGDLVSDLIGKVQILYDTKPTRTKNEVRFWHEVAFSYEYLNKHINAPKNIVEVKVLENR